MTLSCWFATVHLRELKCLEALQTLWPSWKESEIFADFWSSKRYLISLLRNETPRLCTCFAVIVLSTNFFKYHSGESGTTPVDCPKSFCFFDCSSFCFSLSQRICSSLYTKCHLWSTVKLRGKSGKSLVRLTFSNRTSISASVAGRGNLKVSLDGGGRWYSWEIEEWWWWWWLDPPSEETEAA